MQATFEHNPPLYIPTLLSADKCRLQYNKHDANPIVGANRAPKSSPWRGSPGLQILKKWFWWAYHAVATFTVSRVSDLQHRNLHGCQKWKNCQKFSKTIKKFFFSKNPFKNIEKMFLILFRYFSHNFRTTGLLWGPENVQKTPLFWYFWPFSHTSPKNVWWVRTLSNWHHLCPPDAFLGTFF